MSNAYMNTSSVPANERDTLVDERQVTNPAAKEILDILDRGRYRSPSGANVSVGKEQGASVSGTRLYTPELLSELRECNTESGGDTLAIKIMDATTQVAAHGFADQGPLVLLNFASARNPGGGFFGGAKAQEEDLCRCSGLYRTLLAQPRYYTTHREQRSLLYTDHIIYSPEVPFFRVASNAPLLETPFVSAVITAPAPNAGALRRNQPGAMDELPSTFSRRWANILAVARENSKRTLILGAWGCGAFRNDPKLVARTARQALLSERFEGAFKRVVFAIPGFNKHSQTNLDAFRKEFIEAR